MKVDTQFENQLIAKSFSPLTGIKGNERAYHPFPWDIGVRFSPLTGIKGNERSIESCSASAC